MVDRLSLYKVGVVLSVEACGGKSGGSKVLRACTVDVGDDDGNKLTVVTAAPNVRVGSRLAVAPVGSSVLGDDGEEIVIKKTAVGGVMSEGMFCDSRMLGWSGGAEGVAAQMPDSVELGSPPPSTKPMRPGEGAAAPAEGQPVAQGLFEKKLTKEEKKKLAEERKKAKKAAKEQQKAAGAAGAAEDEEK